MLQGAGKGAPVGSGPEKGITCLVGPFAIPQEVPCKLLLGGRKGRPGPTSVKTKRFKTALSPGVEPARTEHRVGSRAEETGRHSLSYTAGACKEEGV